MIIDEIKAVVARALHVPEENLSAESMIGDFPEWNSLGHMLVVSAIEDHFGVTLDSERIMEFESIADFATAVESEKR